MVELVRAPAACGFNSRFSSPLRKQKELGPPEGGPFDFT
jgi:hypothetical protein